jgi:hypothetical protein
MFDQGTWISLQRAVVAVHAVIGGAPGPVYQTLISICAEGLVRARWTAHVSKTQPAILKQNWIGANIDWTSPSGRIVKADGAGMAGVDFSGEDLDCWAASRQQAAAEPSSPLGKEEAARRAVAACYAQGVPRDVQNGPLRGVLADWVTSNLPNMPTISETTLMRAAGRKKDFKANRAK